MSLGSKIVSMKILLVSNKDWDGVTNFSSEKRLLMKRLYLIIYFHDTPGNSGIKGFSCLKINQCIQDVENDNTG